MKTNVKSPNPVLRSNANRESSLIAACGFESLRDFRVSSAIAFAALFAAAGTAAAQVTPNSNTPTVNGLFYGDGDSQRYALIAESPGGSKLYGYFDTTTSRFYSALVVDRAVNDNVVGNRSYTSDAGWGPAHPFNRIVDSEFMGFTLTCGSQSWTWKQGYAAQADNPRNVTNPTWFSSHQAGAGTGTPPPGYISSSSMVWNLNNHAAGNSPSWDVTQGGTLAYNDWKSPFDPASPNTVIGLDGYPATGNIGFSKTHGWEWAMVYEFSVDLSGFGPNPIRLMNISSHHSPAKSGGEDDPIKYSDGLFDWGDLPAPYPTTKAQNGPRHELVPGGAFLGSIPSDIDLDGKPDFSARGDDLMNLNDEDGIRFLSPVVPGNPATVEVTAGTAGYLSAWIDFNGDGTLTKVNLLSSNGPAPVTPGLVGDRHLAQPGVYQFTIEVPSDASGMMYSRWRYTNQSGQGGNSITGLATTGEVEDHALSAIGDFVWNDTNGNGLQDAGEPGIAGVTVRLLDADGILSTTTTGSDGKYLFTGLPAGAYQVEFVRPDGYLFSRPDADGLGLNGSQNSDVNPLTGRSAAFQLNPGEFNMNIDAGLFVPGSIAGTVYFDSKGDHHGDTPMAGVTLCLVDASGEPVCDPHNVALSTTTCEEGCYSFTNLPPGHYQVVQTQPDGYISISDVDGGDLDINGDVSIITLASGQDVTGQDFVESMLTTISGHVFVKNTPLAGVTITLIDRFGNPVDGDPETPGIQPITTVTGSNGYYVFHNVPAGTYMVGQTRPQGYLSFGDADGGDPDLIGDVTPIGTLPGEHSENNDFILTLDGCPDDWNEWKFQHPGETAQGNPDADDYDNLAEFAFAMPYNQGTGSEWLGSTAWVIQPSTTIEGTIEGVFIRPKGAPLNVIYTLQYAATLGNPTVWQDLVIETGISGNSTTVDNGDCTETVTIHDLETLTGLTGGEGFVRIRVDLDDDGGHDQIDHTSYAEVEGWTVTDLEICCQTYNMPYQRETAFTGTISDADDLELVFAENDSLDELLANGASYYIEVTSGNNEGQRFDIVSTSGNTISVVEAAGFQAAESVGSLAVQPPSTLVGDTVAVRRHWTLDEIFPPSAFGATGSQSSADQVQVFAGGAWTIYWLYADAGTPRWVSAADAGMADMGGTIIPPGQGMFFNNRHTATSLLAYGEVRANNFVRPLAAGNNLVGGGYPLSQSANGTGGRAMNLATGFFASLDFKTADSIYIWKADSEIQAPGYHTYYLLDARSIHPDYLRWVKTGDSQALARDAEVILQGSRAAFIRCRAALPLYTSPSPWAP